MNLSNSPNQESSQIGGIQLETLVGMTMKKRKLLLLA
jgi:hypothetical protein